MTSLETDGAYFAREYNRTLKLYRDMSEQRRIESNEPETVFGVLSNRTRIQILRALWERKEQPCSFSELYDAIEIRDSGQFNYHLDKLVGTFVSDTDGGYELTQAGVQINGAIEAGTYTLSAAIEPLELDDACQKCGGVQTFHYEDEKVKITCDACDVTSQIIVPPGVFAEYEREEMPAVANRYFRSALEHLNNGFCPICDGRVEPTVAPVGEYTSEPTIAEDFASLPWVNYDCQQCGMDMQSDIGVAMLSHPVVISFHYDCGLDVRDEPLWRFSAITRERTSVRDENPFRAEVSYATNGKTLSLVVDETLSLVETNTFDTA